GRVVMRRAARRVPGSIAEVPSPRTDAHLARVDGLVAELDGIKGRRVTGVIAEAGQWHRRRDLRQVHAHAAADKATRGQRLNVVGRPGLTKEENGARAAEARASDEAQAKESSPGVSIYNETAEQAGSLHVGREP